MTASAKTLRALERAAMTWALARQIVLREGGKLHQDHDVFYAARLLDAACVAHAAATKPKKRRGRR